MISLQDLTKKVDYHIARNGNEFQWIGYVEVWNVEDLVFHENLTYQPFDSSIAVETVQSGANAEADAILAREDVQKCLNDYVDIKNLGLY